MVIAKIDMQRKRKSRIRKHKPEIQTNSKKNETQPMLWNIKKTIAEITRKKRN